MPMASTLIKIASIGGGLATTTGAGVGIAYLTSNSPEELERIDTPAQEVTKQPSKISELLKNNNLRLLTEDGKDNQKWEDNWTAFLGVNKTDTLPEGPWKFDAWPTTRIKKTAPEEFKAECKKHGAGEAIDKNDKTYIAASTYCSTQLTHEESASRN